MATQYSEEFKKDAVRYYYEHKELGLVKCAKNLGCSRTALGSWKLRFDSETGIVPSRGSGNYQSDEAKENAKLKRELRDAQDALAILKKAIGILGN